jgi:ACR3 family arsenite efflux pump ArsB
MNRLNMTALLFPFLAVVVIVAYAGGLGTVFILLNETEADEWAVIILGMALVVGVPVVAALGQRMIEKG